MSLSAFCRDCGLHRSTFICWLNAARSPVPRKPICRVDPALKQKAIEIYLRYKGTWGAETIALSLGKRLNPGTIRKAIKPYRGQWDTRPVPDERPPRPQPAPPAAPNQVWAIDWTEYKVRGKKFFIGVVIDEASRFFLGWEIWDRAPRQREVCRLMRDVFGRYRGLPVILKSDRAKVFSSRRWERFLACHGVAPVRGRPHCPQDQGVIERGIREVKAWLRANRPMTRQALGHDFDEGMLMLNFLKPRVVLGGGTPARAHFLGIGGERTSARPFLETRHKRFA